MQILKRVYDWLAVADAPQKSDVIFVLAGRECRKHCALQMFDEGWASMLLLSVGRFEVRRFSDFKLPLPTDLLSLAASTAPERRHYFVALRAGDVQVQWIPLRRGGTWSEILAFSQWLRERESVRSGIIVTSGFHLRRVRWCCRCLISDGIKLTFVAVPAETPNFDRECWWQNALARKLVLLELAKVPLYPLLRAVHSLES